MGKDKCKMDTLGWIAVILLIIGGLNWGLYGLFAKTDLVDMIFGSIPILATIVYALIGLAALYTIYMIASK